MILVDTSAWIHLLRSNGDAQVRARVERALAGAYPSGRSPGDDSHLVSWLGFLREDASSQVATSFAALPPEVRAYARTPDLLIVTKANSIATVVSTRVLKPQYAVMWAAFFNFAAYFVFGVHVANTVGKGIVEPGVRRSKMNGDI